MKVTDWSVANRYLTSRRVSNVACLWWLPQAPLSSPNIVNHLYHPLIQLSSSFTLAHCGQALSLMVVSRVKIDEKKIPNGIYLEAGNFEEQLWCSTTYISVSTWIAKIKVGPLLNFAKIQRSECGTLVREYFLSLTMPLPQNCPLTIIRQLSFPTLLPGWSV